MIGDPGFGVADHLGARGQPGEDLVVAQAAPVEKGGWSSELARTLLQSSTHASQMYTEGPAISLRTAFESRPQNEQ